MQISGLRSGNKRWLLPWASHLKSPRNRVNQMKRQQTSEIRFYLEKGKKFV